MADYVIGPISGVAVGDEFGSYEEMRAAGVHRQSQAGISGSGKFGADSVVVSGGYDDDEDSGDTIIYTGHGGQDASGNHIADQQLTLGNLALARNRDEGLPVRVIRGSKGDPAYSPTTGYRYDGLYRVADYWREKGAHGFYVYRFRLEKDEESIDPITASSKKASPPAGSKKPGHKSFTTQRVVRSSAVVQWVKELHDHVCQICGEQLKTPSGPYAEGAHIRPVGKPHHGPDVTSNVLCLCANCHVLFDAGATTIRDDLRVIDAVTGAVIAELRTDKRHDIDRAHLAYHRTCHA
ncbi:MAG: YDG/SRA domain-containing protein [Actinomycetes bacterium]